MKYYVYLGYLIIILIVANEFNFFTGKFRVTGESLALKRLSSLSPSIEINVVHNRNQFSNHRRLVLIPTYYRFQLPSTGFVAPPDLDNDVKLFMGNNFSANCSFTSIGDGCCIHDRDKNRQAFSDFNNDYRIGLAFNLSLENPYIRLNGFIHWRFRFK